MEKKLLESAFDHIITGNRQMLSLFELCRAVAPSRWPILLTGETGVGKELFAGALHRLSAVRGKLVTVNIAGLDDTLLSDALFGHVRGAFTGAIGNRDGALSQAAGGTLFIDEIGDLAMPSQIKLLRLLQSQEYSPLGSDAVLHSDARVILATHRNLPDLLRQEKFREDLYYRISTHHIHIPPLRERRDDLPLLLNMLLQRAARMQNRPTPHCPAQLKDMLDSYDFPGNIRELESMINDAVSRTEGDELELKAFQERIFSNNPPCDGTPDCTRCSLECCLTRLKELPDRHELTLKLLSEALRRASGNRSKAARILGISPQAVHSTLRRYAEAVQ